MGNKSKELSSSKKIVSLEMKLSQFALPPVRDAMVIGHKARIGPHAIEKAFQDLTPGMFKLLQVDHPVVEAILIRKSILRKVDEQSILRYIIEHVEQIMDETDSLKIEINVEVVVKGELQITV